MAKLFLTFAVLCFSGCVLSYPCAVRREIAPCTCRLQEPKLTTIVVACEQMASFTNIAEVLNNRFPLDQDISLKISFSNLEDLMGKSFKDLGLSVSSLNLNFDDLSYLNDSTFAGLEGVESLSLADNQLTDIPRDTLQKMPRIKTLDLGRCRISNLLNGDFENLPTLSTLLLPSNNLGYIESKSIPQSVTKIHLGRNHLRDLNGSLRALTQMDWLFINGNELTTLKDQLPIEAPKMRLIHAANNHLKSLPIELLNYHFIDSLFFTSNDIETLDGVLQRGRKLKRVHLTNNRITTLAEDEFAECEVMDDMELGNNHLTALNRAFLPLKKLRTLNLTHNRLEVFSINEIRGLRNLRTVDLSHNRIQRVTDHIGNQIELETRVEELHLEFNELVALDGALQGIHGLQRLSLHNNKLTHISPDDLIGLDDLHFLDISYNNLVSLEETSKTFLPRLQELVARKNQITQLMDDFHGLPVLCKADLSYNAIHTIGKELGSRTRCKSLPEDPRYRSGFLSIILEGNSIVCQKDFPELETSLKVNYTLLKADMSICPSTTTTESTTTAAVTEPTTVSLPTETTQPTLLTLLMPPHVNISILQEPPSPPPTVVSTAAAPPQVIPLSFSPEIRSDATRDEVQKTENAVVEPSPAVEVIPASNAITKKDDMKMHEFRTPIVVVKDEGQNITLVIPMENGMLKKDHAADHYTQKEEEESEKPNRAESEPNRSEPSRPATITNIEIVEINPLPKPGEGRPDVND